MFKGVLINLLPVLLNLHRSPLKENHAIGNKRGRTQMDRQVASVVQGSPCEDIDFREWIIRFWHDMLFSLLISSLLKLKVQMSIS